MYSLFHMLRAQAGAGGAQLSQQNEGDSGKEEEEFGSDFTAENDTVSYQITNPHYLSFGKILVEVNLTGNAEFFPEQGKRVCIIQGWLLMSHLNYQPKGKGELLA